MKTQRECRGIALLFLSTGRQMEMGGQSYTPGVYPRKETQYRFTGGYMSPRARLDGCRKSRLHRDSIPGPSNP